MKEEKMRAGRTTIDDRSEEMRQGEWMNETSTAITTRYADIGVNLLCFHVFISRVGYLESVFLS